MKRNNHKMSPEILSLLYDVYGTGNDIEILIWRMLDDPAGPMTEDEIVNMLQGIIELHKSRCRKLQLGLNHENQ